MILTQGRALLFTVTIMFSRKIILFSNDFEPGPRITVYNDNIGLKKKKPFGTDFKLRVTVMILFSRKIVFLLMILSQSRALLLSLKKKKSFANDLKSRSSIIVCGFVCYLDNESYIN